MRNLSFRPAVDQVQPQRGFTLVELIVTVSLFGILMALALPSFNEWIVNARIRTAAEVLQNSLRLAQAEALRRNRQVVFSLTNASPAGSASAIENGRNWTLQTIPALSGEAVDFVQGGAFSETPGITVAGAAALCFNSMGRLVANPTPGTGTACTIAADRPPSYAVTAASGIPQRPLRVTVAVGGQIRMCDPARDLSSSDGCP